MRSRRSPCAPEDLDRPPGVAHQSSDPQHLQHEPQRDRLDIIHQDIAHADPRMPEQRDHEDERGTAKGFVAECGFPGSEFEASVPQQQAQNQQRVERHHDGGDALHEPVAPAVMRADDNAIGHHHRRTAMAMVKTMASTIVNAADWRAAGSSTPMWTSSSRWRRPASRWWMKAHASTMATSFAQGAAKAPRMSAQASGDASARCTTQRTSGIPTRNS